MSNTMSKSARAVIEGIRKSQPDTIAGIAGDTYKDITLEDAQRIREGLIAVLDAKTQEEFNRLRDEYIALHNELKRKYRKGGGH